MAMLKCRMCGGDVVVVEGLSCGTCDHCGSAMTLPRVSDERRLNLFNRADDLRRLNEFDRAVAAYESLLNEDNTDAEAHWGLVLSRFGIEYVEDPKTRERLPTCHRVQSDPILRDIDYRLALEHAVDNGARALYERQGAQIAEIQKGLLALSAQEEPYDIFICYKESSEGGSRTRDSVLAQDIYHHLTQEKYRVFFAKISLENRLGQGYEPCIFAALNSGRVMVVVGTKAEHFNAVWVRNEWSRFLSLRKKDSRKLIIPCYREMKPEDLPEELTGLQSQDMEKIGFMQDLVRGIKKVLEDGKPTAAAVVPTSPMLNSEAAALVKRAQLFLEDGDFSSADGCAEKALDKDPHCADAYVAKLMAALRFKTEEQLASGTDPLTATILNNSLYQKALRFSSGSQKQRIQGYNEKRMEEARRKQQEEERGRLEQARRKRQEEERGRLEQVRRKQQEEERQENLLKEADRLLDRGDIEAAAKLINTMAEITWVVENVAEAQERLDVLREELGGLEDSAKGMMRGLVQVETEAAGYSLHFPRFDLRTEFPPYLRSSQLRCFLPYPRYDLRNRSRLAVKEVAEGLKALRSSAAKYPGSEWAARLETAAGELQRRLVKFESTTAGRIDRQVRLWLRVWMVTLAAVGLISVGVVGQQQREAQRIEMEAKAKVEAEEKERVRLEDAEKERVRLEEIAKKELARLAGIIEKKRLRLEAEAKAKAEVLKQRITSGAIKAGEKLVIGLAVHWIPAGRFQMGSLSSEEGRRWNETPHEVALSRGFFLAETECTQAQWKTVMGSDPSYFKGSNHPVESVSWDESVDYCRKLTEKQRSEGMLPEGLEWRLPTEAEWEYAARAGTTGPRYGELDAIAWYADNSGSVTHAVGDKQANDWGLHDMIGNVWEWCSDWDGEYPTGSVTDPKGPSSGFARLYRGGSWEVKSHHARSAGSRFWHGPDKIFGTLGFRPVLSEVWR